MFNPQLILILGGFTLAVLLGLAAFSGPNAAKESTRRLQQVRFRHSDRAIDKVEAQYRKAIASRTPRAYRVAGSASRTEALALRLHRTGKGWTLSQYLYASLGLGTAVAALVFLKSGSVLLALPAGLLVGAGIPHFVVNRAINKRTTAFVTRFPDALELLVRGLRSGLPITETLGVVSSELPGPVGEEFKLVTDRINDIYQFLKSRQMKNSAKPPRDDAPDRRVEFAEDLHEPVFGGLQFTVRDPNGYALRFLQEADLSEAEASR